MKLQRLPGALVRAAMRVQQMVPARQAISGQLVQRATAAVHFLRTRWVEVLAFGLPFALLAASLLVPVAPFTLAVDASIANVAAVQGAVTGLSLIALVLAVEMARRQEDRDDVVYEIMLQSAWIRPTFVFALAALLATLIGMSWSDLSASSDRSTTSPNLLLSTYVLTGLTGLALLISVWRTVAALRPTAIIGYRFEANDRERREKVAEFISYALDEVPHLPVLDQLFLPHRPVGLTATERVFAEIDDALQAQRSARFSGALGRLRTLVERSADQIQQSRLVTQPASAPRHGYWFPLNAINERLPELWRAAYERAGHEYAREMRSLQYWLVMTGVERRSGEMLEVGLKSGLVSYQTVADSRPKRDGHARHEWMTLSTAAWTRLRAVERGTADDEELRIAERLVEYLQEYGNMLLLNDDMPSFEGMLAEFYDTFEQLSKPYGQLRYDRNASAPTGFNVQQHVVLALLALAGRAMLLETSGTVVDAKPYVQALDKFVNGYARIERFTNQIFERERGLQQQWDWWETPTEETIGDTVFWVMPERYAMLALLYQLLKDQSDEPLPSFDGYAQRFIEVWKGHSDSIMKTAEIDEVRHAEVSGRVVARLETSIAAEQREGDDRALAAGIDQQRVTDLITELRKERAEDRVLEYRFAEADRVRRVNESDWSNGQLRQGWLLPRDVFTVGSAIEPMRLAGATSGFERGLFVQLAKELEGARAASQPTSAGVEDVLHAIDVGLHELACMQPLIVLHGKWPREAIVELWQQSSVGDRPLSWAKTDFRQVRVEYKGHWLVQSWTDGDPVLLMLDLDRWGWLVRAPINGEEFGLEFKEIDREGAEQLVDNSSDQDGDREERIREQMLKVRLDAQERVRFEVENPDAALRIPVRTADET